MNSTTYARLTVVMTAQEMQALKQAARQDLRKPRDQARHILRQALLGDHEQATQTPALQLEAQPAGPSIGRDYV